MVFGGFRVGASVCFPPLSCQGDGGPCGAVVGQAVGQSAGLGVTAKGVYFIANRRLQLPDTATDEIPALVGR